MKKNLDFLKGLYIAHRGMHDNDGGIPENSMSAFSRAIESNTPIEIDINMLCDGNIIVFHDDDFFRVTGCNKKVNECAYTEVKELKLLDTEESIPLFADFLDFVSGKVLLDIEIKSGPPIKEYCEKICEILDSYEGHFVVKSFNPMIVYWFKKNRPNFIRGQLSCNFDDNTDLKPLTKFLLKKMALNFLAKPDFIAFDINSLPNGKVARLRKKGYPIFAWTILSNDELEKAKKYADSYICEDMQTLSR